jgi:predicted nucleotidyltransferase
MAKNFIDLSGKIDTLTGGLFADITRAAACLGIPFFVVGATARDMILAYGYGIRTIRATYDIDLGVRVPDWEHYEILKQALIATNRFSPTKETKRLLYKDSLIIDIIPFGLIANSEKVLSWPPDHETEMNITGFEESYYYSLTVRVSSVPILDVQFASLAGLAVMKLISWNEAYPERDGDAKDLVLLMRHYLDAGNDERLFNEESDLIENMDFDYVGAGARLLGRDMAAMVKPTTKKAVTEILDRETGEQDRYRLIEDMVRGRAILTEDFEELLHLLEEMKAGILEKADYPRKQ